MSGIVRIYLCGAHSTGKTTLLEELQPSLNVRAYTNVAREIIKNLGVQPDVFNQPENHPKDFEKFQETVLQHLLEIDDKCMRHKTDYICDRGIDPLTYVVTYLGEDAGEHLLQLPFVQEYMGRLKKSLLFVIMPHKECLVDDGIRMNPKIEELELFTEKMTALLKQLEIPYKVIECLELRLRKNQVMEEVKKIKPGLIRE